MSRVWLFTVGLMVMAFATAAAVGLHLDSKRIRKQKLLANIRLAEEKRAQLASLEIKSKSKELDQNAWFNPPALTFNDLNPYQEAGRTCELLSSTSPGFSIEEIKVRPEGLSVSYEPAPAELLKQREATSGYVLSIKCGEQVSNFHPAGIECRIRHSDSNQVEICRAAIQGKRLRMIGLYGEPLEATGEINIGNVPLGKEKTLAYSMKTRGHNLQPSIKKIHARPEFVQVEIAPSPSVATTGLHVLTITLPASAPECSYQGVDHGMVKVEFDDPEYQPLELDLHFAVVPENR